MIKIVRIIIWPLSLCLWLAACKEVGPHINLKDNENLLEDTAYIEAPAATPQQKNILVEDFTGVRCPNCPQGHVIVDNIEAAHAGRVVALSLHPINGLGAPYAFSTQNFMNQKAQDLFDYIGQIGFEPAGGIDRKKFAGEAAVLLDKSKWSNYATQQLNQSTPVNIELTKTYNAVNRLLTVIVELHYTAAVTEDNKLTVLLAESGIIQPQLDGSVIDTFYSHQNVVRDFLTGTTGDAVTSTLEAGRVVRKVYQKTLDNVWNADHMKVVAFVHEYQNSKMVYQSKELELVP